MVNRTIQIESLFDTMTRVTREITNITDEAANLLTCFHDDRWTRIYRALRKWPVTQQSSVLWTRLFGGLCSSLGNQNILTTIQWKLMRKFELWKLRYSAENASQIPEKDKESSKNRKKTCHGGSQEGKPTQWRATTRVSKMWWWVLVFQLLSSAYRWIYIYFLNFAGVFIYGC